MAMSPKSVNRWIVLCVVALAVSFLPALKAQTVRGAQRSGTVEQLDTVKGVITLKVVLAGEQAQPSDPDLSTGVPEPSQIMALTGGRTQVRLGMPVSLMVEKSGAVWCPYIGTVKSIADGTHCVVEVDRTALAKTWQDPSDQNQLHRAGEYLVVGASVLVMGTIEP